LGEKAVLYFSAIHLKQALAINDDGTPSEISIHIDESTNNIAMQVLILNMLPDSVVDSLHLHGLSSAAECWRKLFTSFNPSTKSTAIRAIKNLFTIRQDVNESIPLYMGRIAAAADQVNAVCPKSIFTLTEELTAVVMLLGIDEIFSPSMNSLLNRSMEDSITVNEVASLALEAETRLSEHDKRIGADSVSVIAALKADVERLKRESWKTSARKRQSIKSCSASPPTTDRDEIIADTGAGRHLFHSAKSFTALHHQIGPLIQVANNSIFESTGTGNIAFDIRGQPVVAEGALHVPMIGKNLFSIGQSTRTGTKFLFDGDQMIIYRQAGFQKPTGDILAVVPRDDDNIYRMNHHHSKSKHVFPASFAKQTGAITAELFHERCGHINARVANLLI
jgi:hypothetical protein